MSDYDPRLVDLYDGDNPAGTDHDFYRALAEQTSSGRRAEREDRLVWLHPGPPTQRGERPEVCEILCDGYEWIRNPSGVGATLLRGIRSSLAVEAQRTNSESRGAPSRSSYEAMS